MAHLIINVLGELQVSIDDVAIASFKSDKVRALLAYLVVEADRSHRREKLIGLLWPDCTEETARHNLRQALFNLRLALGDHTAQPPYLLISRAAIQWNIESDYALDLDRFNTYFEAWDKKRNREKEDITAIVKQLEEMVSFYRGEFLQQFYMEDSTEYENWMMLQREFLRQHMMDALTYLANEHERRGDFQAAHRYAARQLELDPWCEEAHYHIMRVLALDGQRTAALAQYENCKRVLIKELGVEPSATTRDLYEQIRSGLLKPRTAPPSDVPSTSIYNLPISLTPFIGREQELFELAQLIANPECRCITLAGPGGIGKTRLALQAAEQHRHEFAQGSAFIPLASVDSLEVVISTIANAVHFGFYGPSDPKVQLFNYLREKQMLLIIDNVEHLLVEGQLRGTAAELLIEILQQAPGVKLLITSRESLNLQEEWLFEVHGLDFPEPEQMDGIDDFAAVALFAQRARQARPNIVFNSEDRKGVVRICHLVEGMPLAIELAATWMKVLSPTEIALEIEHSLDFLNGSVRDLPERHRSIRAIFDHSWQALPTEEKQVLGRLSIFRGGFLRQAAEQVAGASLSILSTLVTRSLLRRTSNGRYDLHELVRQYAASRLAEDPNDLYSVQERHSLYFLGLLEKKNARLHSSQQKEALVELASEMDNIRAGWDWSIAQQKFIPLHTVSATLWYLFELHNWFKEGESLFWKTAEAIRVYKEESVPAEVEQQISMYAMLAHASYFKFRQGRSEEAYLTLTPSVAFLRICPDPIAAIYSLGYLGVVCWELGRFSDAKENLQESLELSRKCGKHWYEALVNEFLGIVAHDQGEYRQALEYLNDALALLRQIGDPSFKVHVLSYLGREMQMLGEYGKAERLLQEGLGLTRGSEYRFGAGLTLDALGTVAYVQGHYEEARTLFAESADLFRDMGDIHRLSQTLNHQGLNYLALNQAAEAQSAFTAALRLAHEGGLIPAELFALTGLAALETYQKANQRTLELVLYILQHQASAQETKNLANQVRAELEARLAPRDIETTQQCVGSKSLDEFVAQFQSSA